MKKTMTLDKVLSTLANRVVCKYKNKGEITLPKEVETRSAFWLQGYGNTLKKIRIVENPYYGWKNGGKRKHYIECYIDEWYPRYDMYYSTVLEPEQMLKAFLILLNNINVVKDYTTEEYKIIDK
jgi:hypothetical protein